MFSAVPLASISSWEISGHPLNRNLEDTHRNGVTDFYGCPCISVLQMILIQETPPWRDSHDPFRRTNRHWDDQINSAGIG